MKRLLLIVLFLALFLIIPSNAQTPPTFPVTMCIPHQNSNYASLGLTQTVTVQSLYYYNAYLNQGGSLGACNNPQFPLTMCLPQINFQGMLYQVIAPGEYHYNTYLFQGAVLGSCPEFPISMCHTTPSGNISTVYINTRYHLQAHVNHGDSIGECAHPPFPFQMCYQGKTYNVNTTYWHTTYTNLGGTLGACS
jgi:hypothetical protein